MQRVGICMLVLLTALLSACSKKEETTPSPAPAPAPAASVPAEDKARPSPPGFGGVTKVSREVEAVGSTQELAVVAALQSAVAQVNGVRMASQLQSVRVGLDTSVNGQNTGAVRADAFAQSLIAASQGAVTGFEILSQQEVDKVDEEVIARVKASDEGYSYSAAASSKGEANIDASGSASAHFGGDSGKASASYTGTTSYSEKANVDVNRGASSYESDVSYKKMRSYWKVRVRVEVAQYQAPDEEGRPKIVVAMPKTLAASYVVGDGSVAAADVARAVQGRLSDILTQTKRFIVLDREFGSDMQAEIDQINSGNVRIQDSARLGQQLATDLILIPSIERFEYVRTVRQLRMSDRQLVSYSGGGRITLRLLNATTGEVVMSDSFEHALAPADPSTMPRMIDGKSMASEMMSALSGAIGGAIVTEIFPVSVVSLNGDQVVLSQGGDSLRADQRWQAVYLGDELKDPQTGHSLGRSEIPFGTIRIDRVSAQTSYGTVEEGAAGLGGKPFKPGAIELRGNISVAQKIENKRNVAQNRTVGPEDSAAISPRKTPGQPSKREAVPSEMQQSGGDESKW